MLEQSHKTQGKMIVLLKKKKLFSKKNIFQTKMGLVELTALLRKESWNLFLTKVRDSPNQYSIKILSKMTTSTRINRKVIKLVAKSFSK
jgi:hypothetical protein